MSSATAVIETQPEPATPEAAGEPAVPPKVATLSFHHDTAWGRYVMTHREGTLFHTLAWRNAVKEAFSHEDCYLVARREDRIVGAVPLFFIRSRLTGRMLVSVPYGVGGGIIADDIETAIALFNSARELADRLRCDTIDLRSERAVLPDLPTVDDYVGFRRELPGAVDEVPGWLPRKARAAARNARTRYKLTVSYGDEHVAQVWRLYSKTMRRLGSISYPLAFFERLIAHTPDRHFTSIVRRDGRTVGGLITFLFKDRVMPYFFGSTDEARRCGAANLVYLSAMQRGVALGYRVFDFGRSRRDNVGSANFKRFNGFTPRPLGYQRYTPPGRRGPDLSPGNPRFRFARRLWPYLPLCVTRVAGARLARHIPG